MSRRSRKKRTSSNGNNVKFVIIGFLALAIIIVFGMSKLSKKNQLSAKPFPLDTYVKSCNSLRGNIYQISGEIIQNANHDPRIGKFIFLRVIDESQNGSTNLPNSVGILVPARVKGPNLETKQQYTFVVNVKREGLLVANSYAAN